MRAVNLLPVDEARAAREGLRGPLLAAVAGGLAVAAAVAAVALAESSTLRSRRADLASVQVELAATPPVHAPAWQARVQDAEAKRTAVLATALGERLGWERVVRELAGVLPRGVFLTRVDGESPQPAASASSPAAAATLTLEGVAPSHAAVADLVARLAAVPDFGDVSLQSSAAAPKPAPPSVTFTLVSTLRTPGGPS